ncbi:hypothetical protein Ancab_005097 [Ancistrocladus abbreviatus]
MLKLLGKDFCRYVFYDAPAFSPIGRVAQAFSLASTRSHLVIPGIVAVIVGELGFAETAWAESDYFPSRNAVYSRGEDGQVYITKLLSAILEFLFLMLRALTWQFYSHPA